MTLTRAVSVKDVCVGEGGTLAQVFIYEKEKTFQHQINIKATVGGKIKMLSDYMS